MTGTGVVERVRATGLADVDEAGETAVRALFGDRFGATLFAVALVWFGLTWRFGFLSNDQYTVANTLVGVADGHLYIDRVVYGPASGVTPGTHATGGRVYGRDYGLVVVSAAWLLAFETVALVADVRVVLLGLWALAVVGAATGVGAAFGRRRRGVVAGVGVATVAFVANLLVATPLAARWLPLLALQVTTALAGALTAVVLYRLVARAYGRRVALAVGFAAVLGTPVALWATQPRRHALTAAFAVFALYTLYRSREAPTPAVATRFRVLTYAWAGFAAWVHAAEGLVLLLAVAAVDLPTAPRGRTRDRLLVAGALVASFLPFLLTNALISGNPLLPPRLLPVYEGGILGSGGAPAAPGTGTGAGAPVGSPDSAGPLAALAGTLGSALATATPGVGRLLGRFGRSLGVLASPDRLVAVFVRWGYVPGFPASQDDAINLSVLASMPLLAALVAWPVRATRSALAGERDDGAVPSPLRVVDAFSVLYVALLCGLYLGTLPLHHMMTVRYLHPLYAVGLYWLARLPAVRAAVAEHRRSAAAAYAVTVLVGVPSYLLAVDRADLTVGEGVQLHALAALAVASAVALWAVVAAATGRYRRSGGVALGVGTGATSVFLLVSGLSLFPVSGEFLLPVARVVAERVHYVRLFSGVSPF